LGRRHQHREDWQQEKPASNHRSVLHPSYTILDQNARVKAGENDEIGVQAMLSSMASFAENG
jgi:hypothetical protein